METIFKVGMKVYDQVVFPDKEGMVVNIVEKDAFPIKVYLEGVCVTHSYTKDGRITEKLSPTLSTSSYTIVGFEQKAPTPTYDGVRTEKFKKGEYVSILNGIELPDEKTAKAFEALSKLIWLRDYYNEGWKPDWCNQYQEKFCIINFLGEIDLINYSKKSKFEENKFYHVLTFETEEIRDKFLEEQKELLEIAKPLI